MAVEQIEKDVRRSSLVVRNPALDTCACNLVCKFAGRNCVPVCTYILEMPMFNASMYPNGMINIYMDFLLRTENEAQSTFDLGHKIWHFLERP